jgi:hypothetical protein
MARGKGVEKKYPDICPDMQRKIAENRHHSTLLADNWIPEEWRLLGCYAMWLL